MKIAVDFERVEESTTLDPLRTEYLRQLPEVQEMSVEVLVPEALHFTITHQGVVCGYFLVHPPDTLIEFHLTRAYLVFGECVFEQILERAPVKRAFVKSYDHLLFSSSIARHTSLRVKGLLAREIVSRDPDPSCSTPCRSRVASSVDLPAILAVDQRVFRHPERLRSVIDNGQLYLFEADAELVGFGIARPVIVGQRYVELGIAVDRRFRGQGYSVPMFRSLIDACIARGFVPVSGVAVENEASRSMGERAGMIARYRLLELGFD